MYKRQIYQIAESNRIEKIDSVAKIESNRIETFLPELECSSGEHAASRALPPCESLWVYRPPGRFGLVPVCRLKVPFPCGSRPHVVVSFAPWFHTVDGISTVQQFCSAQSREQQTDRLRYISCNGPHFSCYTSVIYNWLSDWMSFLWHLTNRRWNYNACIDKII